MTIISKTAGALSAVSYIKDIHETAKIVANEEHARCSSDSFIECAIGTQKANRTSYRDAKRKDWILKNNFWGCFKEPFARIYGYLKGVFQGIMTHAPSVLLSTIAIFSKNKKIANISTIALGITEIWDYLKNASNLFERTDYLK